MYTRRSKSKTVLFSSLASTKHIYGIRPDIAVVENSKAVLYVKNSAYLLTEITWMCFKV